MKNILDSIIKIKAISTLKYECNAIGSFNKKQLFGGSLTGHALSVGNSQVSKGFYIHHVSSHFLNKGNSEFPLTYHVQNIIKSKTFNRVFISCTQDDKELGFFNLSFKQVEPSDSYVFEPKYDNPLEFDKCLTNQQVMESIKDPNPMVIQTIKGIEAWLADLPFTLRFVDSPYLTFTKVDEPICSYYFQLKEKYNLSDNELFVKNLLIGFMSDYGTLYPIVSKHNRVPLGFITTLDHSIWFHNFDFDINQRFFLTSRCKYAGNCLSVNVGSIWSEDKKCLATIVQQGLVREHKGSKVVRTPFN